MKKLRILLVMLAASAPLVTPGQEYGKPDRDAPGDEPVQRFLADLARKAPAEFLRAVDSAADWQSRRPGYYREYMSMLGLWPLPERTPLRATVMGELRRDGFVVEKLHYQSRPGLYVTANLYRPADAPRGERLPAVLYVCGHSPRGRDGNKTAYQSHAVWFARHGYVCLVVDTLQLGEIAAIHHGTYREGRWWWHSRGYTSAGVECWNGVRGIDYLVSREDVDPDRIAVTGISGGGAATFWVAAADERVKVAVPVSGMADLPSYVANRVINGHCDCMFLHNTYAWPWTRIAALIAPRPLLFVNSDRDPIFPMDANERIAARLERLYALFGAGELVDSVVSLGGHAYREDIRRAAYRFINTHLKGDGRPVTDSEVDLVEGRGGQARHPIAPAELRVFRTDADIPQDEKNTTIDQSFVPIATVQLPADGKYDAWRNTLLDELRSVTFRDLPWEVTGALEAVPERPGWRRISTEGPLQTYLAPGGPPRETTTALIVAAGENAEAPQTKVFEPRPQESVWLAYPRGTGPTRWTRRDPPNYVERAHVLLGRTVDGGRVRDMASIARAVGASGVNHIRVAGSGAAGVVAAYAALWTPEIDEITLVRPPADHMTAGAPQLLNVLRVCDIADVLGMLAPRPLTLIAAPPDLVARVRAIYAAAGAAERLRVEQAP